MSDRIWNSRFIQAGRTPAWHLKGWLVGDERLSAEASYERTGIYEVNKVPLVAKAGEFEQEIDYCIIVREPVADDPVSRIFGRPVTKDYELIGPRQAAQITDRAWGNANGVVSLPMETFGVLGKGEELFITSKIRSFDIKGDEVDMYIFLYSPMYSDKAAVVGITAVRIVCANTLATGIAGATQKFYIDHRPGAAHKVETSMASMLRKNEEVNGAMVLAFNRLADKRIKNDAEVKSLVEQIYTAPPEPKPEWDMQFGITYEAHVEKFEEKMAQVKMVRSTITDLYHGLGTGMDTTATMGTRFGLYNAVAEYETYRRGPHDRAAVSLVAGDRASTIRKAFDVLSQN